MHATGIQLDHAFFIGAATEPDILVIGVIFRPLYDLERSIECVASASEKFVALINPVVAVFGANEDWEFTCALRLLALSILRQGVHRETQRCRTGKSGREKIATRDGHAKPRFSYRLVGRTKESYITASEWCALSGDRCQSSIRQKRSMRILRSLFRPPMACEFGMTIIIYDLAILLFTTLPTARWCCDRNGSGARLQCCQLDP